MSMGLEWLAGVALSVVGYSKTCLSSNLPCAGLSSTAMLFPGPTAAAVTRFMLLYVAGGKYPLQSGHGKRVVCHKKALILCGCGTKYHKLALSAEYHEERTQPPYFISFHCYTCSSSMQQLTPVQGLA